MPLDVEHDGRTFTLTHHKQFGGSPAEVWGLRTMAELLACGWATSSSLGWSDPCVTLTVGDALVAAIVYRQLEHEPAVSIILGWTQPQWRRQGLYGLLFRQFAQAVKARHPEVRRIDSGYHVDNAASAAMHAALGRRVTYHATTYSLEKPDENKRL